MHLTLIVRPVEKESVQGRHEQPVLTALKEDGQYKVKDTGHKKRFFRAEGHTPLKFLIDSKTGKYKTGLDEIVANPFFKNDPVDVKRTYNLPSKWDDNNLLQSLLEKEHITKQHLYEIYDSLAPGEYHNEPQNNMLNFIIGAQREVKPKSLIEQFEYMLYSHGSNTPSTETSRGRLAIQAIKNNPSIAPDKDSINESKHDWYIAKENEAENDRAKMDELVNDAIFELQTIKKTYSPFDLYRLAVILKDNQTKLPLVKGDVNEGVVLDRLNSFIKDKTKVQEKNISQFMLAVKMFHEQPELFQVKYMVQQGENSGVLYSRDGTFFWRTQSNNPTWHKWKNAETFLAKMVEEETMPVENNYFIEFEKDLKEAGIRTR